MLFFDIRPDGRVKLLALEFDLIEIALNAEFQDFFHIHGDMRVAGSQIPFGADNSGFVNFAERLRHQGAAFFQRGFAVPILANFLEFALDGVARIKCVARAFFEVVQFLENPLHRVFRENRRGADLRRLIADNQFAVVDENRHLFQRLCQRKGAFEDDRLRFVLLIHGGVNPGAFDADG